MRSTLTIAGHEVGPGERVQFDLPVAQLYTNTPLHMPVEIINGRRSGPVLLVCAAIHGDELNGVEIIRRLRTMDTLRRIRGTLILVPVVNLFGFIRQSRYLPDRRDLNRCFPGSQTGSLGSRVAYQFFTEIVCHCTHAIDLHTGAIHRHNLPQLRCALDDNPEVERMAKGFRLPVIINSGLLDGSLRYQANSQGIAIITYEAGEALRIDEHAVVVGVRGILNVMRTLGMLRSRMRRASPEPYVAKSTTWCRSMSDGLFRPLVKLGARVAKGQTLGVVSAPFGESEEVVVAPTEGIVICVNNLPLVNGGEALFHLARFDEAGVVEEGISAHQDAAQDDPLFELETVSTPNDEDP